MCGTMSLCCPRVQHLVHLSDSRVHRPLLRLPPPCWLPGTCHRQMPCHQSFAWCAPHLRLDSGPAWSLPWVAQVLCPMTCLCLLSSRSNAVPQYHSRPMSSHLLQERSSIHIGVVPIAKGESFLTDLLVCQHLSHDVQPFLHDTIEAVCERKNAATRRPKKDSRLGAVRLLLAPAHAAPHFER